MMVGRREGKSIRATAREIGRSPRRSSASRAATPRAGGGAAPRPPGAGATPGGFAAAGAGAWATPPCARSRRRGSSRGSGRPSGWPAGWRSSAAGGPSPAPPQGAPSPAAGRAPPSRGAPPGGRRGACGTAASAATAAARGGRRGKLPHPPRDPRAARPRRDARRGEGVRGLGPGGEGGGGGVLLLRRPPPPGEGGRREHQRAHPRAPSQGHRLLPRHRRGGRGGVRWDQPQAAQAPGLADSPGSPLLRGVALALKIQEQMDDLGQMPSRNMLPTLSIASSGSSTPTTSPKSSTPTTMRPPSLFANATTLRAMPSHTSRFSSKRSDSRSTMMASGPARPRHAFQTRIPDTTVSR